MKLLFCLLIVGVVLVGVAYSQEQCKDRETRIDDCNHCYCYNNTWICSLIPCHPTPPSRRVKRDDAFSCTPGQTFKKDCNTCTCTPDGKNALCTLKDCRVEKVTQ